MARIHPFQPLRYTSKAGRPSDLVTQPYDKIPDALRERYLAASPYNFIRLIKGKAEPGDDEAHNVYTRAAALLDEWIDEGILAADPKPGVYPYFQEFTHPETGDRCVRKAFISIVELAEYGEGVIYGHELTHSGPKLDRLRLTEATQAYFGQLFFLYDDPALGIDALLDAAAQREPLMQAEEEGVVHKLWRIDDPATLAAIERGIADKKLLIADGHHRYETALAYAREHPDVPGADKVMISLVNMSSPGLVVLATHRVLEGLQDFAPAALLERAGQRFSIEAFTSDDALRKALENTSKGQSAIGMVLRGDESAYLLRPKPGALDELVEGLGEKEKRLDVVVLHRALIGEALGVSEEDVRELKGIRYIRGFENAVAEVRNGQGQVAFLLRPVDVQDVAEISFAGGVMPQKSTDFYPKLLSGFATYRFGAPKAT
ncbi:MAG: DUF1015 domain-containing protein [Bryobacterales bacterium]|nr:DUF1015 domain-containing protein [Bryobacterales bacterium]